LAALLAWLLGAAGVAVAADGAGPTVGMEGRLEVTLPGTLLEARPVQHKARLILRVAETRPREGGLWYDLRYIGLVPGRYDLRTNLVRLDGSAVTNLPGLPVEVRPLLPAAHDGLLVETSRSPLGRLGGYRAWLTAAAVVWVLVLVPLLWRRRRAATMAATAAPEPTLADRLRPLVEEAAAGRLSGDGQARLERMLLNYWRDRLGLGELDMAEALRRLRGHPEAGELLRALEGWLHRPPGAAGNIDVARVLEPYRNLPAAGAAPAPTGTAAPRPPAP
jgi:hypothetical protein